MLCVTWAFSCSVSLVVVVDASAAAGGDAKLDMCDMRVVYANTLALISRESTTIDANACAVLLATFIFLQWYIRLGRR